MFKSNQSAMSSKEKVYRIWNEIIARVNAAIRRNIFFYIKQSIIIFKRGRNRGRIAAARRRHLRSVIASQHRRPMKRAASSSRKCAILCQNVRCTVTRPRNEMREVGVGAHNVRHICGNYPALEPPVGSLKRPNAAMDIALPVLTSRTEGESVP